MVPKLPITSDDKEWVNDHFAWFFQQFGTRIFYDAHIILLPGDLLPNYDPSKFPDEKTVIRAFCKRLSIPFEQIILDPIYQGITDKYGLYAGMLGSYASFIDPEDFQELYLISLNMEENIDLQEIFGTLIHEFCHIKLLGENRISVYQRPDHEFLTDLLTIFWGFGVISANEAFYSRGEYYEQFMLNYSESRGYLPLEVWAYGLALYAILRGESYIDWPNALGKEIRPLFDSCLDYLNFEDTPFELDDFPELGVPPDPQKRNLLTQEERANLLEKDRKLLFNPSSENLYERAEENYRLNLLAPAAQDYFHLAQSDPYRCKAYSGIAKTFLKARQLIDCQTYLDKAFQLNPKYEEARITQAHLYLLTYQLGPILTILDPIPSSHPHRSEAHHILGMIAYENGDPTRALLEIAQAIALRPTHPQFFLTQGIMYLDLGETEKAEASINQVITLNPDLYVAYTYKGILLRKKNRFEEAINYLEKTLEVNPEDEQALWHLSLTQQREEHFETRDWVEVYYFTDLEAALPIRKKLKEEGINFRIRDEETLNFSASTSISKCILLREENVEKVLDLIGSNVLGWEEYAY